MDTSLDTSMGATAALTAATVMEAMRADRRGADMDDIEGISFYLALK